MLYTWRTYPYHAAMANINLLQYYFQLPSRLIARHSRPNRDQCRLLVVDRQTRIIAHHRFSDLRELLRPGDLLVVNDTKVIPARLFARRASGGRVEVLVVNNRGAGAWDALVKPLAKVGAGERLLLGPKSFITVRRKLPDGMAEVKFSGAAATMLSRYGQIPLPPYMKRVASREDQRDYQTVYARHAGAVAAPTAGLHFTPQLLNQLAHANIKTANVTLHVGYGTFQPLREAQLQTGILHAEKFSVPAATARAIQATRKRSGRIVAVGTTVVRTLEHSAVRHRGQVVAEQGKTQLLITPGYRFRVVDALITNFHLPQSSLLLLVCAFGSRPLILRAYREAIAKKYRFYSYGDAMLIV